MDTRKGWEFVVRYPVTKAMGKKSPATKMGRRGGGKHSRAPTTTTLSRKISTQPWDAKQSIAFFTRKMRAGDDDEVSDDVNVAKKLMRDEKLSAFRSAMLALACRTIADIDVETAECASKGREAYVEEMRTGEVAEEWYATENGGDADHSGDYGKDDDAYGRYDDSLPETMPRDFMEHPERWRLRIMHEAHPKYGHGGSVLADADVERILEIMRGMGEHGICMNCVDSFDIEHGEDLDDDGALNLAVTGKCQLCEKSEPNNAHCEKCGECVECSSA